MSLDATVCAANITSAYGSGTPSGDYPADFASAYHDYASLGVIPGAISGGGDSSIIETFLRSATSSSQTIDDFAQALTDYWVTVGLTPEPPNISSVNDAAGKFAAFKAAIESSITSSASLPYFEQFIINVEAVALTIQWTITPPAPLPPFVSNIS